MSASSRVVRNHSGTMIPVGDNSFGITEQVEVSQSHSSSPLRRSDSKKSTVSEEDGRSTHTFEEQSTEHNNLVFSVITKDLVPPSSLFQNRMPKINTPPRMKHRQQQLQGATVTGDFLSHCGGVIMIDSDDDDESSTSSPPYFRMDDFQASTWYNVLADFSQQMSVGAAATLLTTAAVIVHPLATAVAAGAVVYVWAVGAVGLQKNFEYISDVSFTNIFWNDAPLNLKDQPEKVPHKSASSEIYAVLAVAAKPDPGRIDPRRLKAPPPIRTAISFEEVILPASTILKLLEAPLRTPLRIRNDQKFRRDRTLQFFPSLEHIVVEDVEFPGLSATELFGVFFSDDAPYNFCEFQKKRGDVDIDYGKWGPVEKGVIASLHIKAQGGQDIVEDHQKERILRFKTLTKSYFGPAYASAIKTQRVTKVSKRFVIIESRTRLQDIPFCDRFQVVDRWVITSERDELNMRRHIAKLSVSFEIQFLDTCTFESQIRKKSSATMKEIVPSWCEMARKALEITEQHKLLREQDEDDEGLSNISSFVSDVSRPALSSVLLEQCRTQALVALTERKMREVQEKLQGGDTTAIEVAHSRRDKDDVFSCVVGEGGKVVVCSPEKFPTKKSNDFIEIEVAHSRRDKDNVFSRVVGEDNEEAVSSPVFFSTNKSGSSGSMRSLKSSLRQAFKRKPSER